MDRLVVEFRPIVTKQGVSVSLDCINFQMVDRMKLYELLERKQEGIGK